MRELARRAVACRAQSVDGAGAIATAVQRAYDDLARVSSPLIGQLSLDALTGRMLYLAQRRYPWLVNARMPDHWSGPFPQIVFCLETQEPDVATEAAGAVLAILMGLLITFIGEPLTTRVLEEAWPDAFADASPPGRHET
jgi:hypothetical protein